MNALETKMVARFIVDEGATVRMTADVFGISKSTVHRYVTKVLKEIDLELHQQVKEVLDKNKAERHIRGGIATRSKFKFKKI